MREIDMSTVYRTSSEAMASKLGSETVLLHLGSGTYFGMDEVGTLVWQLLDEGLTPKQICNRVAETFDEVPDTVGDDILAFLEQLVSQKLISPA